MIDLTTKRLVVTGGAGFLGGYVVSLLEEAGCRDLFVPRRREYNLVDGTRVRALYRDTEPDVVIHLAAVVGGIGATAANPARFFYENLMMGAQLIHEGWKAGVEKFVSIGTVCSYPKNAPVPFKEDDLWKGYPEETNAPYGLAKKMMLVQCQAYRAQYGFNAIHLLPVNLYGPGDNFDPDSSHVIPALIRKFIAAREGNKSQVVLWGDGTPSREFLHVRDAARGIVLATERYDGPLPINLGSSREISIAELAQILRDLCRYEGDIVWDRTKPKGQPRRLFDTSRAREFLGFTAEIPLEEGLAQTVSWYEANRSNL